MASELMKYAQTHNMREIAEHFDFSNQFIRQFCKDHNIPYIKVCKKNKEGK